MKRKLTRSSIDEIRKEMPVLSLDEERTVFGGGNFYIMTENGTIVYTGNNISSNETIIAIGSVDSGNIIRLPGDTHITQLQDGGYMITGSGVNKQTFESVANSTCVEWSLYENRQSGNYSMNTSNAYRSVVVYAVPGYDTHYHNHEYNPNPSSADIANKGYYSNYYIYYEGNGTYRPY